MDEKDDIYYAEWLSGELSDEEVEKLRESGDLGVLEQIVAETDSWQLPPVRASFEDLKQRREAESEVGSNSSRRMFMYIAASLTLLLGLSYFGYDTFFSSTEYATVVGETKVIELPDGTQVTLNGGTTLSFENYNWEEGREVQLAGQAFFDVEKKGPFEVVFDGGSVNVLGTEFDVMALNKANAVKCFEGKVSVELGADDYVLTPGMGVRSQANETPEAFSFGATGVQYGGQYQKFEDAPLMEVMIALSLQYGITYEGERDVKPTDSFTGQIPNDNLDQALYIVTQAMGITYEKTGTHVQLK